MCTFNKRNPDYFTHSRVESVEEPAPVTGAEESPADPGPATEMTFEEKLLASLRHLHV